jgi:hypothetical protein
MAGIFQRPEGFDNTGIRRGLDHCICLVISDEGGDMRG